MFEFAQNFQYSIGYIMDKYFKIQRLVEMQKERKEKLEEVLPTVLGFLPKFEIDFRLQEKMSLHTLGGVYDVSFVVKLKIQDKSSVKFVVNQKKQKILEEYSKIFVKDILVVN